MHGARYKPPERPKIYHIAHIDTLPSVLKDGGWFADATMVKRPGLGTIIGMADIKARRLTLPVECHPPTCVGDYVPFYFCSRSIMLYLLYRSNHEQLAYRGGQGPIVHFEFDMHEVVQWAEAVGEPWAFSLSNAGAKFTEFRCHLDNLNEINWMAVANRDFRPSDVNFGKQAEFLVHRAVPWGLVSQIGVHSLDIGNRVVREMAEQEHRPPVQVQSSWYF